MRKSTFQLRLMLARRSASQLYSAEKLTCRSVFKPEVYGPSGSHLKPVSVLKLFFWKFTFQFLWSDSVLNTSLITIISTLSLSFVMLLNHFTLLLGKVKFCQHTRTCVFARLYPNTWQGDHDVPPPCPCPLPPRANRVNCSIQFSEPKWKRVAADHSYEISNVE